MTERVPLTWGQVKSWAAANGVQENAVIEDDDGRYASEFSMLDGQLSAHTRYWIVGSETYGGMLRWAAGHDVPDSAPLRLSAHGKGGATVVDVSLRMEEDEAFFVLQRRWG